MKLRRSKKYWSRKVGGNTNFEFTINTATTSAGSSASDQITLPYTALGTYSGTIDWGDASSSVNSFANRTHTYASSGTYTISISGVLSNWTFGATGDRLKITDISNWGIFEFNENSAFNGCSNLDITALDNPLIITVITNAFLNCSSLVFNSSINNWDVSGVGSLQATFRLCPLFNQNIGDWNISNVTTLNATFANSGFNNGGSSSIQNWNTSLVSNMGSSGIGTFSTCPFNQPIGIWDVSSVNSFNSTFRNNTAFNQDIGDWDVSLGASFSNFMNGKSAANYSAAFLDSIYNKWSLLSVQPNQVITFGTIKYTGAGTSGRNILTGSPNNWTITDGGI
jgi:hypothetical protein